MSKTFAVVSAFALIVTVGTTFVAAGNTLATKTEVRQVSEKVDRHLLEQERAAIQKRMWDLEDRWTERFWKEFGHGPKGLTELLAWVPQEVRDEYRDLAARIKKIDERLGEDR